VVYLLVQCGTLLSHASFLFWQTCQGDKPVYLLALSVNRGRTAVLPAGNMLHAIVALLQLSAAGVEVAGLRGEVGQLVGLKEAAEQDLARLSADLAAVSLGFNVKTLQRCIGQVWVMILVPEWCMGFAVASAAAGGAQHPLPLCWLSG
jgi:hypothetical protein